MKYKKQLLALALCLLAMTGVAMAGSDDFLITLSWLEDRLLDPADAALDKGLEGMEADVLDRVDTALKKKNEITSLTEAELDALASQAAAQMSGGSGTTTLLTASKGDRILGPLGAGMLLESGTATVGSFTGNDLIDVTAGTAAAPGTAAVIHHSYIVGADNGCGLTVTSDTATVIRLLPPTDTTLCRGSPSAKREVVIFLFQLGPSLRMPLRSVLGLQMLCISTEGREKEAENASGTAAFSKVSRRRV